MCDIQLEMSAFRRWAEREPKGPQAARVKFGIPSSGGLAGANVSSRGPFLDLKAARLCWYGTFQKTVYSECSMLAALRTQQPKIDFLCRRWLSVGVAVNIGSVSHVLDSTSIPAARSVRAATSSRARKQNGHSNCRRVRHASGVCSQSKGRRGC